MIPTWRGVIPAICTPFTSDHEIDLAAQRRVVRFAIDHGAHGILAFGLAGEVLTLTARERKTLTEVILDEAGHAVPVLVGAGGSSVEEAIELALHAERAGASCIVLPAPLGGPTSESLLVDYFARVASAVSVPVMIQDAPVHLGIALGAGVVEQVGAEVANVRLVKLEAGPAVMSEWIERLDGDFAVWGGDGGVYLLDCVRIGAAGIIPGVDLVDLIVEVYEHESSGDSARADELFRRILPLLVFEMQHTIDHYNACAKHVLVKRRILTNAELRPPAAPLRQASQILLEQHLADLNLDNVASRAVN